MNNRPQKLLTITAIGTLRLDKYHANIMAEIEGANDEPTALTSLLRKHCITRPPSISLDKASIASYVDITCRTLISHIHSLHQTMDTLALVRKHLQRNTIDGADSIVSVAENAIKGLLDNISIEVNRDPYHQNFALIVRLNELYELTLDEINNRLTFTDEQIHFRILFSMAGDNNNDLDLFRNAVRHGLLRYYAEYKKSAKTNVIQEILQTIIAHETIPSIYQAIDNKLNIPPTGFFRQNYLRRFVMEEIEHAEDVIVKREANDPISLLPTA